LASRPDRGAAAPLAATRRAGGMVGTRRGGPYPSGGGAGPGGGGHLLGGRSRLGANGSGPTQWGQARAAGGNSVSRRDGGRVVGRGSDRYGGGTGPAAGGERRGGGRGRTALGGPALVAGAKRRPRVGCWHFLQMRSRGPCHLLDILVAASKAAQSVNGGGSTPSHVIE